MKIGLFFGSFNPPHVGHTAIAEYMLHEMQADAIWMVVSPHNPFKESSDLLSESKRLELVETALQGDEQIVASDVEFDLPRPSYTIDTMQALANQYPEHDFFLIMGSDNILGITGWKAYRSLIDSYDIAVYPRPGYEVSAELLDELDGRIIMTKAPSLDISSTYIRKRIAAGESTRYFLRDRVWEMIVKEGLY